jgi:hypothetical protein
MKKGGVIMIDIGWLIFGIMFGGSFLGFLVDYALCKAVERYREKHSKNVKKRREFKPGTLGKYGPE